MAIETATRATMTDLLRQDHKDMKRLFNEFERSEGRERERIVSDALSLIQTHDVIEQTLLYPSVRGVSDISRSLVLRCEEAHHVVHLIMAELKVKPYSERYFAKFSKLADGILAHVEEEERELFPAIENSSDIDNENLGRRVRELKASEASMFIRSVSGRGGAFASVALLAGIGWAVYRAFSGDE